MQTITARALAWLFAVLALAAPDRSSAQVAFETSIEMLPGGTLSHGSTSLWRFSMTNTGTAPIETPITGTSFIEVGSGRTLILHAVAETAPCTIHYTDVYLPPTQQVQVFADVFFADSPLAVGATTSCIVGITIDATAPIFFVQEFGFQGGTGPDTANSFVQVPFLLGPLSTPIPTLHGVSIALLAFVIVLATCLLGHPNLRAGWSRPGAKGLQS